MKRIFVFLFVINTFICITKSQVYIGSKFKPLTYDEIVAPLERASRAFDEALAQYQSYEEKYQKAFNENDFSTAKMYLERMQALNNRFSGDIIPPETLSKAIKQCNELIVKNEKFNELKRKYEIADNYLKMKNFDSAKKLYQECSAINRQYNLVDQEILDQAIAYCNEAKNTNSFQNSNESSNTAQSNHLVDVETPCMYINGSAAPEAKFLDYQTTSLNKDCVIKKITTTTKRTIIELEYSIKESGTCSISPKTYIEDKRTGQKHVMLYCEGIALTPGTTKIPESGGSVYFKLYFPALPSTSYYVDLIESDSSPWQFFNVKVRL